MLLCRVLANAALQHDPPVEVDVGGLLRHRKVQRVLILVRLVHGVDRVSGPLVVGHHLAGDHVRLAGIRLEGIDVVLHVLQIVLHQGDGPGADVVHLRLEFLLVIRCRAELLAGQQIMLQGAEGREVRVADVVLDGHLPVEGAVVQNVPGGCLLLRHDLRIVDDAGDAPHVARRVAAPGFAADLVLVEDLTDIGGHAPGVVIVFVGLIEESIGKRDQHALGHELHEHVLRRTDNVVDVAQRQHVVEVLVGAEGGVLDLHLRAVGLPVPLLEILDHAVLAEDIAALQVDDLVLAPVAEVDVLFPVADPERYFVSGCRSFRGKDCRGRCRQHQRSRENGGPGAQDGPHRSPEMIHTFHTPAPPFRSR